MAAHPSRSVNVKDVAATAGVSLGTVSNVLNRPERVREATRAKVHAAMVELGFVRNESARALRSGRSALIAYVLLDAGNPFFTDVAVGIEDVAEPADLSVFMCSSHQSQARERAYLARLQEQRVQGVLITPVDPRDPMLDELPARGTPVVLVDRTRESGTHCSVSVDDRLGGRLAVEHLLERGHSHVAYVAGPEQLGQVRERREGARDALAAARRDPRTLILVPTMELTIGQGRTAADRIAAMPPDTRPTAAFCGNDLVALGLLQRCIELGLTVPDDLAVVGFDDIDFAAAAAVPLTSVRQPRRDLGQAAARLLLDEATNPGHVHEQLRFTPQLIARRSSTRAG